MHKSKKRVPISKSGRYRDTTTSNYSSDKVNGTSSKRSPRTWHHAKKQIEDMATVSMPPLPETTSSTDIAPTASQTLPDHSLQGTSPVDSAINFDGERLPNPRRPPDQDHTTQSTRQALHRLPHPHNNRKTRDETSFLYPDSGIYLYRRESGFMSKTEPYEDAVTFRRTLC